MGNGRGGRERKKRNGERRKERKYRSHLTVVSRSSLREAGQNARVDARRQRRGRAARRLGVDRGGGGDEGEGELRCVHPC